MFLQSIAKTILEKIWKSIKSLVITIEFPLKILLIISHRGNPNDYICFDIVYLAKNRIQTLLKYSKKKTRDSYFFSNKFQLKFRILTKMKI